MLRTILIGVVAIFLAGSVAPSSAVAADRHGAQARPTKHKPKPPNKKKRKAKRRAAPKKQAKRSKSVHKAKAKHKAKHTHPSEPRRPMP